MKEKKGYLFWDNAEELLMISSKDEIRECYCGMPLKVKYHNQWINAQIRYNAEHIEWLLVFNSEDISRFRVLYQ